MYKILNSFLICVKTNFSEHCSGLTDLNIGGYNEVTDEGVVCLAMKRGSQITKLNLSFCNTLTDTAMKSLGYHCSNIQHLNIQGM